MNGTIKNNLLAISVTAILIILWLALSFWVDAYLQRRDAVQAHQSLNINNHLYELTSQLIAERQIIDQAYLSPTPIAGNAREQLDELYETTLESLANAVDEVDTNIRNTSVVKRLNYKVSVIGELLTNLQHQATRLKPYRKFLISELEQPATQRGGDMQEFVFEYFGDLIRDVEALRVAIHYSPSRLDSAINGLLQLYQDLTEVTVAMHHHSLYVSRLLLQKQHPDQDSINRIHEHFIALQTKWESVEEYADSNHGLQDIAHEISLTHARYSHGYLSSYRQLYAALRYDQPLPVSSFRWKKEAERTLDHVAELDSIVTARIREHVYADEAHANRRLAIDTGLVIISLIIALGTMRLMRRIQHQAYHDPLTELPNRSFFESQIRKLTATVPTDGTSVACLYVDLDGFKDINDTLGHPIGDKLLKSVGTRFSRELRVGEQVFRVGGDEFVLIISACPSLQVAEERGQDMIQCLEQEFHVADHFLRISASIGICVFPQDASSSTDLLRNADIALGQAKSSDMQRVCRFDEELADRQRSQIQLQADLREAADRDELRLCYQPQVSVKTGRVIGVEALVRWEHQERGMLSPNVFIPLAEESGSLHSITTWVMETAITQASLWHQSGDGGLEQLQMAINIGARQFEYSGFVDQVVEIVERTGVNPGLIELEVTEGVVMQDIKSVIANLENIRACGFKVAIDDFGTGFSSLSYLQDLPIDCLKIDRSFINRLSGSNDKQSVALTISQLASSLGLHTVAEGVETTTQLEQVRAIGCHVIQGYLYSKPVTAEELPHVVEEINRSSSRWKMAG